MIFVHLFVEFFLIGLFAVGGGLATLPFLYRLADKTGWFTPASVADMVAISEATPGAIGVNMATYAGFITTGIAGGVVATLGLILPSVIIISFIAHYLQRFKQSTLVQAGFRGLRPAALGLIGAAGMGILALSLVNSQAQGWLDALAWRETGLFVILLVLMVKVKIHPVWFIGAAAIIGISLGL